MAEYIEREELLREISGAINYLRENPNVVGSAPRIIVLDQIRSCIAECHTVVNLSASDVQEVVRCKDCVMSIPLDKYQRRLYRDNCVACTYLSTSYHSVIMGKDDFCSYGERGATDE